MKKLFLIAAFLLVGLAAKAASGRACDDSSDSLAGAPDERSRKGEYVHSRFFLSDDRVFTRRPRSSGGSGGVKAPPASLLERGVRMLFNSFYK